ncbi:MAG: hypothetical protein H6613_13410 [Ignavibacteriales bacterium]|nr:hypothetical protein [Ignavibacteriales bacterium]
MALDLTICLAPVQTIIGDKFVVFRDKLINDGILNPPYTDAPEFHDSILNGIEYWNGKKFVKYFNP